MIATVYKIPNHDVALIGQIASFFEHLQHIKKLSVNVTTQSDRSLDRLHIRLFEKQSLYFSTNLFNREFRKYFAVDDAFNKSVEIHGSIFDLFDFIIIYIVKNNSFRQTGIIYTTYLYRIMFIQSEKKVWKLFFFMLFTVFF